IRVPGTASVLLLGGIDPATLRRARARSSIWLATPTGWLSPTTGFELWKTLASVLTGRATLTAVEPKSGSYPKSVLRQGPRCPLDSVQEGGAQANPVRQTGRLNLTQLHQSLKFKNPSG